MLKAELRPAGSFIQNTPTTAASTGPARRPSIRATPSRRAESRATPAAAQQVASAVQEDEGPSQGEVGQPRRPQRPSAIQDEKRPFQGEVRQPWRPQRPSAVQNDEEVPRVRWVSPDDLRRLHWSRTTKDSAVVRMASFGDLSGRARRGRAATADHVLPTTSKLSTIQ